MRTDGSNPLSTNIGDCDTASNVMTAALSSIKIRKSVAKHFRACPFGQSFTS